MLKPCYNNVRIEITMPNKKIFTQSISVGYAMRDENAPEKEIKVNASNVLVEELLATDKTGWAKYFIYTYGKKVRLQNLSFNYGDFKPFKETERFDIKITDEFREAKHLTMQKLFQEFSLEDTLAFLKEQGVSVTLPMR